MNHAHDHAPSTFGHSFAIGIALNVAFVLIEAFYGWCSGMTDTPLAMTELHEHFDLGHVTLQIESERYAESCVVGPAGCGD